MEGQTQYALYHSSRCANSRMFMEALKKVPGASAATAAVCIDTSPFPSDLREVPAVVDGSSGALWQGKEAFVWLARMKASEVAPLDAAYGGDGPSPGACFSDFVEGDGGHAVRQHAFSAFLDEHKAEASQSNRDGGPLDALVAQRRLEIPQPITRQ